MKILRRLHCGLAAVPVLLAAAGLLPAALAASKSAPVQAGMMVGANLAPADALVVAAHAAAVDGDVDRLAELAPQMAGTILEPYADYWQASVRLRAIPADDGPARVFLGRYAGSVLADRLRVEWLLGLASRGDFAIFEAERRRLVAGSDDPQLACYTLLARFTLDDGRRRESIVRDARHVLANTVDPGGDGCTALADRLLDEGLLGLWPRLQALVERSQYTPAHRLEQRLPPAEAASLRRLLEQPARWLAAAEPQIETLPHAPSLLAMVALSRDKPELAARYAQRLDPHLTPEERALVWGRIGRSAQLELLPQAHEWYGRAGELIGYGLDYVRANETLETRARAALRRGAVVPEAVLAPALPEAAPGASPASPEGAPPADAAAVAPGSAENLSLLPALFAASASASASASAPVSVSAPVPAPVLASAADAASGPDWIALRRIIAQMPPELQSDQTWAYWNAQALIALGHGEEGRAALRGLAEHFSYYGRLAAEQLGLPPVRPARPAPPLAAQVDELALRPGFLRARKLYALGLREEANREWGWELRGMDDSGLHAAAEVARRFGLLDRMIASSERTRGITDLAQRYPMPFPDLMAATSAPLAMDPAWIYGLIRQESRFIQDVHSNVGAIGLMQLMPATARFVAHRIGLEGYRPDRVADVGLNLRLGTEYLKLVFDDQDGQPLLASAAYNAGPARVRRWRASLAHPLEGAIFAETIPIGETRDYVKRVLFNTVVYAGLLERSGVSLQGLLAPVSPHAVPANELP